MIELYTANTSNGQRAAVILEECGLPYHVHKYDLMKGEQKNPEFLAINPSGAIPVIVDSDGPGGLPITLAQSGAILIYCAEKTGKFLPRSVAARAQVWQWLMQATTDVAPASSNVFYNMALMPEKSEANGKFFAERLVRQFGNCNAQLAGREYLAGELSVADFALYPIYALRKAMLAEAAQFPHLSAWGERMGARPGVQKGLQAAL